MSTYRIPEQFIPELQKKVAKIAKRASKLGTAPVTMKVVGEPFTVTTNVGGSIAHMIGGSILSYKVVNVEVEGHAPIIEGWEFVAVVRHKRTGNEFNVLPGMDDSHLGDFRTSGRRCDHCQTNRVRNATYVVRHVESGDMKLVGSTCLADFTGYNDPQAAANACENIFKMFHEFETYERTIPRTSKSFFTSEWMAFVAQQLRKDGVFYTRTMAGDDSTASRAKTTIIACANGEQVVMPSDEDFARAEAIIQWANQIEAESEFMENLTATLRLTEIVEQDMGISAYAFEAHRKAAIEEAKKRAQATQGYIGTPGEKITVTVTVDSARVIDCGYGPTNVYDLTDEASGNKLTWFTKLNLEKDERATLTATVKKQEINNYTGNKVTQIGGRVKVSEPT